MVTKTIARTFFIPLLLGVAATREPVSHASTFQAGPSKVGGSEEVLLSEFTDRRTGTSLIAKAGSASEKITEWLARLNKATTEPELKSLLSSGERQGLLSVSATIGGVAVTTSLGAPPRRDPPAGTLMSRLQEQRTGATIVMVGSVTDEKSKEWLTAVSRFKAEAELVTLVRAERANGLVSATTSFPVADQALQVTTFFAPAQK